MYISVLQRELLRPAPFISGIPQIQPGLNKLADFAQSASFGQQAPRISGRLAAMIRQQAEEFIIQTEQHGRMYLKFYPLTSIQTTGKELTKRNEYSFQFVNPEMGKEYYFRLKMIDLDGTFAYSRIVRANASGKENSFFYPNPASEKIQLHAGEIQNSSKLLSVQK